MSLKIATIRAATVLIPSYSVAFMTEKMVYVVPMLAASSFFAAAIGVSDQHRRRVEEDEADGDPEAENILDILD